MPFEQPISGRRHVAVVGGGISGLGAAWRLGSDHRVTLFESAPRLGGHARTLVAGRSGDQPVDTGFIVFNHVNYPHLTALFEELQVPIAKSSMSFGASFNNGQLEYSVQSIDALFAQRRNLIHPAFMRLVRDLVYFNNNALAAADDPSMTVAQLLAKLGTSDWFRDYYLLPFSGAIWSTPRSQVMDFPAYAMIQFFKNHGLLGKKHMHQWYTVKGGSTQYVSRLTAELKRQAVDLRTNAGVHSVRRAPDGVHVKTAGADWERFDEVVFATHSDVTLSLLDDPSATESTALGQIKYQPNTVTLHCDPSVMPKRRKVWSSWNYTETTEGSEALDLTYWMNSLQPIPKDDPHFVTLNDPGRIREDLIYDQTTMRHPVYGPGVLEAQDLLKTNNGTNRTWFCGAWMRNGFHEDGLASAVSVADGIRRTAQMPVAAE
ncbi:MAG: NAD(P)/FAD-dependent oxidoreductase [Paracoccaceae bacterium]